MCPPVAKAFMIAWLGSLTALSVGPSWAVAAPIDVFVSVAPQASVVRDVGGPHVLVHTLVGSGQDPHLYEPSPRQVLALGKAKLFLTVGMPFERAVLAKIRGNLPNMKVVDAARGVKRLAGCDCGHDHHHGHAHETADDPHVWLSPDGLRAIAKNTAEALAQLDPAHKNDYDKRLKQVINAIDKADTRARLELAPYRGRAVYVFHPAFGYFCEAYGLKQKAVEVNGRSPGSRQLRELVRQAKKDNVRAIFVQQQFDQQGPRVIARALDADLVAIDPLADDAVANLERIAKAIASGLKQK